MKKFDHNVWIGTTGWYLMDWVRETEGTQVERIYIQERVAHGILKGLGESHPQNWENKRFICVATDSRALYQGWRTRFVCLENYDGRFYLATVTVETV
jgi:hypothetical protein